MRKLQIHSLILNISTGMATSLCISAPTHAAEPLKIYSNYEEVKASTLPGTVLWKVIAREGKAKRYQDLLPLDGGTVGIAHFAVGGLASLYRAMDTQKYFGKSREEMIKSYSSHCRPPGKSGNDAGWGCYSKPWWRTGMDKFLKSPESRDIQHAAWAALMHPAIQIALEHGWNDERSLAIALGIANSMGASGFNSLGNKHEWQPEKVLAAYASDAHRKRRKAEIDKNFPKIR